MSDAVLMRLLEVVVRELGAVDARVEIGGQPPADENVVWLAIEAPRRVVAVFQSPPEHPEAKRERLSTLIEAFHESASDDAEPSSLPPPAATTDSVLAALRLELEGIAVRVDARAAIVFDGSSPMVWAAHPGTLGESVEALLSLATGERPEEELERLRHDAGWAIELARKAIDESGSTAGLYLTRHEEARGFMARGLGGAYIIAMLFASGFSEPRAHGAIERSRDRLEKLIARLPPVDPPPKGGKVVRLRG